FQTTGRVEAQHYILEVGIQVAEAILAIKDLPFGSVRVSRPGEKDAIELNTRFQFVSERMSKSGRHPLDADVLTGHERLIWTFAAVKQQVQSRGRLDARAVLPLGLK